MRSKEPIKSSIRFDTHGFEGGGTGLPFEFLPGVFDLGFDLFESVDGVLENQRNGEGTDEGETAIVGGGDCTFEDGCGSLIGGGRWETP